MRSTRRRAGRLGGLARVRAEAARRAELAAGYNLPRLYPKEVELCLSLVNFGRPAGRAEWLRSVNLKPGKAGTKVNGAHRLYVPALEAAGLVARVRRYPVGRSAGRLPDLYLPTARLLDALAGGA